MRRRWNTEDVLLFLATAWVVIGVVFFEIMLLTILFGSELPWPLPGKLAVAAGGHIAIAVFIIALAGDSK